MKFYYMYNGNIREANFNVYKNVENEKMFVYIDLKKINDIYNDISLKHIYYYNNVVVVELCDDYFYFFGIKFSYNFDKIKG